MILSGTAPGRLLKIKRYIELEARESPGATPSLSKKYIFPPHLQQGGNGPLFVTRENPVR